VSLKDEIEKMIQAEREKLESRDKKEQDAHLVIGLYNEAMEKAQDNNEILKDREVELKATILKNRNGSVNDEVTLTFDHPILKIREKI
jgi:hypothetical protein